MLLFTYPHLSHLQTKSKRCAEGDCIRDSCKATKEACGYPLGSALVRPADREGMSGVLQYLRGAIAVMCDMLGFSRDDLVKLLRKQLPEAGVPGQPPPKRPCRGKTGNYSSNDDLLAKTKILTTSLFIFAGSLHTHRRLGQYAGRRSGAGEAPD